VAFGFGVIGTLFFAVFGRDLKKEDASQPASL